MRSDIRARAIGLCAAICTVLAIGGPASAEIVGFIGDWTNAVDDGSGISSIEITAAANHYVSVRVTGTCDGKPCDWGTAPGQIYTVDPQSLDIRAITAEFSLDGTRKHLVLHRAIGQSLRFQLFSEFTDGRSRSNYETVGNVQAGTPEMIARRTTLDDPGNFKGPHMPAGAGPAVPAGYVPSAGEDCIPFDLGTTRAAFSEGAWRVGDFAHQVLTFSSQTSATRALAFLRSYGFDEECVVKRDGMEMTYWKRLGQIPRDGRDSEICTAFDPATATVAKSDGEWRVVAGDKDLLDYGSDKPSADLALSVIATYRLNRRCLLAPTSPYAQYWLSQ